MCRLHDCWFEVAGGSEQTTEAPTTAFAGRGIGSYTVQLRLAEKVREK